MSWKISLSDIDLNDEEIRAVTKVLRSRWLSMGPVTKKFEEGFANYLGVKHAFAVCNGTAALHIAHKIFGIGPSDEVILPSLTFVASSNSVLYTDATPIFADIVSLDDFNISPEDIQKKITPKTKAITVVHYGGYPANMKEIMKIAEEHNLYVIEDAAHAPGAEYKRKKAGTIGDVGCFSFFANKNIVTGEGGMIVTDDDKLAEKIRLVRSHGMSTLTWDRHRGYAQSYDVLDLGYNYRTNELCSALGLEQLRKLDKNNEKRREIVKLYGNQLESCSQISIPFKNHQGKSSYHIFPILLSKGISRSNFINKLREKGIQTSIHYLPIHLFTYYKKRFGFSIRMLPKTEYIGEHELTLPLHPLMNENIVEYVTSNIKYALEEAC